MNILLTGATGFIGRELTAELINSGYEVYAVIRPTSKNRDGLHPKLNIIDCDLDECENLAAMDLPPMTACIHLAWDGASREGRMDPVRQKHNEELALAMVRAAHELGCSRFVLTGSQAEYGVTLERIKSGEVPDEPVTEDFPCNPISEYGKSKLNLLHECTKLCNELGMSYIHARIFSAYGAGDRLAVLVNSIVNTFAHDGSIELSSCEQKWNYIYITDCVKALADLAGCVFTLPEDAEDEDHVVNIAGGETKELREFVKAAHERIGRGQYKFREAAMGGAEGTPYLNPDNSRLKALTGFREQVDFNEGIDRILAAITAMEENK